MRRILIGAALATALAGTALAQPATVMGSGTVCLKTILVDHTKIQDAHTVLYFMKDGSAWQSNLKEACTTLPHNGYIYMPTPPDNICGGLQMIRVIQTKEVCELGPFTPYTPPPPAQ